MGSCRCGGIRVPRTDMEPPRYGSAGGRGMSGGCGWDASGPAVRPGLLGLLAVRPGLLAVRPGLLAVRPGLLAVRPGLLAVRPGLLAVRPGLLAVRGGEVHDRVLGGPAQHGV